MVGCEHVLFGKRYFFWPICTTTIHAHSPIHEKPFQNAFTSYTASKVKWNPQITSTSLTSLCLKLGTAQ